MSKITINNDIIQTNLKKDVKLIIVSDIHIDSIPYHKELLNSLIRTIYHLQPDFILIPGDTIQSYKTFIENVSYLFRELGKIAPTILSLGNHELEATNDGLSLDWFHNLERFSSVYPLDNSSIVINHIQFSGFSPALDTYFTNQPIASELFIQDFNASNITRNENASYSIMLCHNPNFITEELLQNNHTLSKFDLFVSGHNHNGCVPKILEKYFKDRGLIGPYFNLFPKNCRGLKDIQDSKLLISKGYRKITQEIIITNYLDSLFNNDINQLVLKKKN